MSNGHRLFSAMAGVLMAHPLLALEVTIGYISQTPEEISVLSEMEERPEDLGLAGALLAIEENNTTGKFLDQLYKVETKTDLSAEDALLEAKAFLEAGIELLVVNVDADTALAIADLEGAQGALIFNAGAEDNALRDDQCRSNMLHTMPSLAMRTDALAQFLNLRKWKDLALVVGEHESDQAYGASLKNSLYKFGFDAPDEYVWKYDADMRRSAFSEGPLFSQDFAKKDVILVADEIHDFGRYLAYNTWAPQIMAGSEGLQSEAWTAVAEQWGAVQLQNRFTEGFNRGMESEDYAAYAAIRAVGEAVTRVGSMETSALRAFMLSDDFELAGFKGQSLSFRGWNGQLRQPMPVFHERALVALAPLEGYLHKFSELDTLGIDEPESQCEEFSN